MTIREKILDAAKKCVCGDGEQDTTRKITGLMRQAMQLAAVNWRV